MVSSRGLTSRTSTIWTSKIFKETLIVIYSRNCSCLGFQITPLGGYRIDCLHKNYTLRSYLCIHNIFQLCFRVSVTGSVLFTKRLQVSYNTKYALHTNNRWQMLKQNSNQQLDICMFLNTVQNKLLIQHRKFNLKFCKWLYAYTADICFLKSKCHLLLNKQ